jgi:hypothetical protein
LAWAILVSLRSGCRSVADIVNDKDAASKIATIDSLGDPLRAEDPSHGFLKYQCTQGPLYGDVWNVHF